MSHMSCSATLRRVIPAAAPRRVLVAAVAALALAATACHGGDNTSSGAGTSLVGALASVAGTDAARAYFEWSDVARIRDLSGVTRERPIGPGDADHRRWTSLFGTGAGNLRTVADRLADTVNLFTARSALTIGTPPRTAIRIDGVDTGAARAGLVKLGGKAGTVAGHDGVILAGDNEIKLDSPLASMGVLNTFNKNAFDGDRVAFGPVEAQVGDALSPGDHPLSAEPSIAEIATCLGQVVTVTIVPAGTAGVGAGAQTVAVGVRNPAARTDAATEELCLATADKSTADALERQVRQHATTSAVSAATRRPWSSLVSAIAVTRTGDRTVRVELTDLPDRSAGLLAQVLAQRDLASLTG
jgi:hypothetical protein